MKAILIRQQMRKELGLALDDFVVISVGELNDNKNHQIIIRAIAEIHDPKVKYVLVGRGNLEQKLRDLTAKLGVEERVKILGYRTEIRDLLWASDCFAFPSKREGLGLAAIEAMAAGLPVIGNNIGGIQDYLVDGVTGFFADNNSNNRKYSECIKMLESSLSANQIFHNARKTASSFDRKISQQIMQGVYHS